MGYWNSMLNLSFFYNEYAEILMKLAMKEKALELLCAVTEYNPNYAASRLNLAEIYLDNNDVEKAQNEYSMAHNLLADADEDYILIPRLKNLGERLSKQ
jgi:tetratricopeptide (TPR) repeat protein